MPLKTCNACSTGNGPNAHACKGCGTPFSKKGQTVHQMVASQPPAIVRSVERPASNHGVITIKPSFYENGDGAFNLNPNGAFDHLYGKDAALSLILSSLNAYNVTKGEIRPHCLAVGSPSSGKTTTLDAIERMVGKDNVFRFNAETASLAGVMNTILNWPDDNPLPPLLIAEEICKVKHPDDLLWMVQALDKHATIEKITARETKKKVVPFLCIATCNNFNKLADWHSGAVASRFSSNTFYLDDMTDDIRRNILRETLKNIPNGNPAWIDKAIEFGHEVGKTTPRQLEGILVCGMEKLMTGEYQATYLKASKPRS
jgi:hypothetical protein